MGVTLGQNGLSSFLHHHRGPRTGSTPSDRSRKPGQRLVLAALTVVIMLSGVIGCAERSTTTKGMLNQARIYMEEGRLDLAGGLVEKILAEDDRNVEAAYLAGQIAVRQRDIQSAAQYFHRVLALETGHREAKLALAELLSTNGQYDQARTYIEQLLKSNTGDREALKQKVKLLLVQKRPEQVEAVLGQLEQAGEAGPEMFLWSASAKALRNDLGSAEKALVDGIAQYPGEMGIRLSLARLMSRSGRTDEAVAELRKVIELEPDNIAYMMMLAALYWDTKQVESAESVLTDILAADPANVDARILVADFYLKRSLEEKAESVLKDGIKNMPGQTRLHLVLARLYQAGGQHTKAIEVLLAHLGGDQKPEGHLLATAHLALAQSYYLRQETAPALTYTEKVLAIYPDNLDAIYLRGRIELVRGRLDQAFSAFKALLAKRPYAEAGYLELARAYSLASQGAAAVATLQQGTARLPKSKNLHLALARAFLKQKDFKGTENALLRVLEIDPADVQIQAELGDFYLQLKDTRQAEREFAEIVTKFPEKALGYIKLARLYTDLGKIGDATEELRQGYRRNPGSNELMRELVRVYLANNKTDDAIALCKARLAAHENDAFAHFILGQIHVKEKKTKEARKAFETAVALAPEWPDPANHLAALFLQANQTPEAVHALESSLLQNPRNAAAYLTLAQLSENEGDYEKAERYYERGLNNITGFGTAAQRLALILSNADNDGDMERALQLALKAYQLAPGQVESVDTLGWIYHLRGEKQRAKQLLEMAASQAPDNPVINYHMAMVLIDAGQPEKARERLDLALKNKRPFIGRRAAEQALAELEKAG